MPNYLIKDSLKASLKMIGYADDSTVYIKTRSLETLKEELEELANNKNLVINTQKTQILTNTKQEITVKIGQNMVSSSQTITLLGMDYDENFSAAPYLRKLEANTLSALIKRLSFGMPNCLLKPLANGLLMGKLNVTAPAAIPIKLSTNDKCLTQAVCESMAISIWRAQKEKNPLGRMFQNHVSERYKVNLLKPIHGYPEAASNKLAQL